MVDKTKPKGVVKSPKKKETKAELFLRLATKRVSSVLNSFRILGNCSNRNNYEYTTEQVETMFERLQVKLNSTESMFTPSKKEQISFKF